MLRFLLCTKIFLPLVLETDVMLQGCSVETNDAEGGCSVIMLPVLLVHVSGSGSLRQLGRRSPRSSLAASHPFPAPAAGRSVYTVPPHWEALGPPSFSLRKPEPGKTVYRNFVFTTWNFPLQTREFNFIVLLSVFLKFWWSYIDCAQPLFFPALLIVPLSNVLAHCLLYCLTA